MNYMLVKNEVLPEAELTPLEQHVRESTGIRVCTRITTSNPEQADAIAEFLEELDFGGWVPIGGTVVSTTLRVPFPDGHKSLVWTALELLARGECHNLPAEKIEA